jgi:hypothetical protein
MEMSIKDLFKYVFDIANSVGLFPLMAISMIILIARLAFDMLNKVNFEDSHAGPLFLSNQYPEPSQVTQDELDRQFAYEEAERSARIRRHEKKQTAHKCAYCGTNFREDNFGNCKKCGAPRD